MHEYELRDVSLYENRTTFILDEYETYNTNLLTRKPLIPSDKGSFTSAI
jgi:hypothetical protein